MSNRIHRLASLHALHYLWCVPTNSCLLAVYDTFALDSCSCEFLGFDVDQLRTHIINGTLHGRA